MIYCLYQNNALRNFNYIVACPLTKEAVVIDPLDGARCLQVAEQHGLTLTHIINTHEHWDHIAGNETIAKATNAKVMAHAKANIPNMARGVQAGEIIQIGKSLQFSVLDTPGHTFTHICLLTHDDGVPALFSGDTLFNAGCGNCHSGDMDLLFKSISTQLFLLSDDTRIFPGHDYLANNLAFAQTRDPHNPIIQAWLSKAKTQDPTQPIVTTIGIEKQINPFFRLTSPNVIQQLQADFPAIGSSPSAYEVFTHLRTLRNRW